MITVYHIDLMIETWRRRKSSARNHQRSEGANMFSYAAARTVEQVCEARIELARIYRARIGKGQDEQETSTGDSAQLLDQG